jgi:integrase
MTMATVRKRKWMHNGAEREAWVVTYTDQGGTRRLKTFDRKKDADAFRLNAEIELQQGVHVADAATVTVSEALDMFLTEADRRAGDGDVRRSTAYAWRLMADKHVRPYLGAVKLNRLSVPMVQEWLEQLAFREREKRGRASLEKALQVLRLALAEMQRRGRVARNVVRDAPLRIPGAAGERVEIPSKAEVRSLLAASEGFLRPFLHIAVFAGLRKSEIRALDWNDVDLAKQTIRVSRAVDAAGRFGPPKSRAGVRSVPIAPALLTVLREWKLASPPNAGDYLFPSPSGEGVRSPEPIHQAWCRLQIAAEMCPLPEGKATWKPDRARYRFHALRHFAASLFIESGLPPKTIQTVMGHASINMTFDRYGHLFEGDGQLKEAMKRIGAAL